MLVRQPYLYRLQVPISLRTGIKGNGKAFKRRSLQLRSKTQGVNHPISRHLPYFGTYFLGTILIGEI